MNGCGIYIPPFPSPPFPLPVPLPILSHFRRSPPRLSLPLLSLLDEYVQLHPSPPTLPHAPLKPCKIVSTPPHPRESTPAAACIAASLHQANPYVLAVEAYPLAVSSYACMHDRWVSEVMWSGVEWAGSGGEDLD